MVDCARTLCPDSGLVVADSALRLGASRAGLERIVAAAAGKRGIVQARSVLALADERSESPGETLVRYAAHRAGAPPPTPQLSVPTSAGTFRLDLAWPDVCVGVEFDGAIKYSDEFGDPVQRLLAEKRRHDALVDAGWWIVRVSWEELHDLEALGTKLLRARRARSISAS